MKKYSFILLLLVFFIGAGHCFPVTVSASDQTRSLTLLFSGDLEGNIKPCFI